MKRIAAVAVLASLVAAAGASADQEPIPLKTPRGYKDYCDGAKAARGYRCQTGGVPTRLWHPLALPAVASGAACPVSRPRTVLSSQVFGAGPIYLSYSSSTWRVPYPAYETSVAAGTGWDVTKVPLLMKKQFRGAFVVRGRRLDGPGTLGFSGGAGHRPFEAMQFPASRGILSAGEFRGWGLTVWMTSPGCYAMQIDGPTFSRVVVFRVEFTTA